jgi:hypothetical protein
MIRRTAAAASAALAALATIGACTSTDDTTSPDDTTTTQTTQPSNSTTTPPPDEPIDISRIPEDTPLEPGTYSMPFLNGDETMRAIVDVPDGYTNFFSIIGSDDGDGDMAFWGKVTQVDTDPCLGGKHVRAGTSVHDLASALVAQRHMKTTQPGPVTIGGYQGVSVKITAPADINRCREGSVTIYGAGDSWLQLDVPSATFHEWILNVHGTRVVGGARMGPDSPNEGEFIEMVESARFSLG